MLQKWCFYRLLHRLLCKFAMVSVSLKNHMLKHNPSKEESRAEGWIILVRGTLLSDISILTKKIGRCLDPSPYDQRVDPRHWMVTRSGSAYSLELYEIKFCVHKLYAFITMCCDCSSMDRIESCKYC